MIRNFLFTLAVLLVAVLVSSCVITGTKSGYSAETVEVKQPAKKNDQQLTEAEKKALIEADLWVPSNQ